MTNTRFYTNTFTRLVLLFLIIGFLTRVAFLFNGLTEISFSGKEWASIFALGIVNDLLFAICGCLPMWLFFLFLSEIKYKKPWGYLIFGTITLALIYVCAFHTVFNDYGSAVPTIVKSLLAYKFVSFGLRLFIPSIREYWRRVIYAVILFTYAFCLLFNAIGEYCFWNEFGVRYNFIAVDYLIYTNEVIGNIMESYPVIPIFGVLIIVSAGITVLLLRGLRVKRMAVPPKTRKCSIIYIPMFIIAWNGLDFNTCFQNSENLFVNELQSNGEYRFYSAFLNNSLDYYAFYPTLPDVAARSLLQAEYNSAGDNLQYVRDSLPEIHKNIVLITVESLSASFMSRFGNTEHITPNLDSLYRASLAFDNLFATGNRTVRGLEAVTLSLPPSPGQSLIKRPGNGNFYSTASVLKDRGYTVQYFYGGDSYFDNMESFFGGNGYEIIDRSSFEQNEISFQNIWGVCDEDMFRKAISVLNRDASSGKPFFAHIMTVSNHRPFTYPDGRIDIPSEKKTREGGVKYTDYAIGKFIKEAQRQSWFDNTVFVIVADHCASSAGRTRIPLSKYHIPALIYAPGFIQPKEVKALSSQIDLMPTLFGLLHFSYDSHFYGKNVFAPDYKPRGLIATYQSLGYLEDSVFTVLSPTKKVEQYTVSGFDTFDYETVLTQAIDSVCYKRAIANYQTAADMIKRGKYKVK
jgi:phosphoglycerol transferase MdoB-like AlkP superfamily enzyme